MLIIRHKELGRPSAPSAGTRLDQDDPSEANPEKFRRSLADDVVLWAPVVNALGLKID
jgi:hypothetical protein